MYFQYGQEETEYLSGKDEKLGAVIAQVGAVLGIFLATRDARQRVLAGSAFSAGLFGITEPAIYGLTLPLRRPFIFGCVAGAIGGAITAFSNSYAYSFGLPNIFFPAQMIPPGGIDASVWGGLIGTGVAFVLACVLTFFAGLPRASAAPGAVTVAPVLCASPTVQSRLREEVRRRATRRIWFCWTTTLRAFLRLLPRGGLQAYNNIAPVFCF